MKKVSAVSRGKSQGFTLIELLVVIAIIGVLAAAGIPKMLQARNKAKWSSFLACHSEELRNGLNLYYVDKGHYPYNSDAGGKKLGTYLPTTKLITNSYDDVEDNIGVTTDKGHYTLDPDGAYYLKACITAPADLVAEIGSPCVVMTPSTIRVEVTGPGYVPSGGGP